MNKHGGTAQEVLKNGGYIVVDEIENHFNKEIVTTLMRFSYLFNSLPRITG